MNDSCSRALAAAGLALALAATLARANVTLGAWPTGPITLTMRLDTFVVVPLPTGGLADGSAGWTAAVRPTLDAWNPNLARSQFADTTATTGTPSRGNGLNDIFFSNTIYGEAFGSRTLAVTLISRAGTRDVRFTETDVIFNTGRVWDSYRGALRTSGAIDIRRVALHEFGHVLGLDHPDEDTPAQSVAAIMNSIITDTDTLQADDIDGAQKLYGAAIPTNLITRQPSGQNLIEGGFKALDLDLDGHAAGADTAVQQYAWFFTPTGGTTEFLFTQHEPRLLLGAAQPEDSGTYSAEVDSPDGERTSVTVAVNVAPVAADANTRLANLSTRGLAGTGDHALIVGFVIGGAQNRRVLLRAIGPTLASSFGVSGAVADTTLTLNGSPAIIASNDNWGDGGGGPALTAAFQQVSAFALPDGSLDSALIATLAPGTYTALVTPKNGVEGVALVEAYDLDDDDSSQASRLINLSTRGFVGTGDNLLIAGLVVRGSGPRKYLLRAVGDTMKSFGVAGTLDDPVINLFAGDGTRLRFVDDWDTPAFLQPKLQQRFTTLGAFPLTDRQESVMVVTLNPGSYTLQVSGFQGGTGVALIESYEVGAP